MKDPWLKSRLIEIYADETTQEIREKLYYYLSLYRRNRPDWTIQDWINGLSIVLKSRLSRRCAS